MLGGCSTIGDVCEVLRPLKCSHMHWWGTVVEAATAMNDLNTFCIVFFSSSLPGTTVDGEPREILVLYELSRFVSKLFISCVVFDMLLLNHCGYNWATHLIVLLSTELCVYFFECYGVSCLKLDFPSVTLLLFLCSVITILELFNHESEDLKIAVQQQFDLFNPNDLYWTVNFIAFSHHSLSWIGHEAVA